MKNLKYFMGALLLGALVVVSCKKDNEPKIVDDGPVVEKEAAPALAAPGAGKVVLAIRVPDGTCNGAYVVGTIQEGDGWKEKDDTFSFKPVENTESWLAVELPWTADMGIKVLAKPEDAALYGWAFQWGVNTDAHENVTIVAGDATIELENGNQPKLTGLAENSVVYVDVDAWASAPCQERNKEGKATWKVTPPAGTPATAVISVVGGWGKDKEPEYWTPGAVLMERQSDGTYTLEKDVPAAFQYKYVVSADGKSWSWDYAAVPNENRDMPVSLKVEETIESWTKEPWDPDSQKAPDMKDCEMELVGAAIAEQTGSAPDNISGWDWGNVLPAGKPAVSAEAYTWTWANVSILAEQGFKVRTVAYKESGGIAAFDLGFAAVDEDSKALVVAENNDGNIIVNEAGNYEIVFTVKIADNTRSIKITKK